MRIHPSAVLIIVLTLLTGCTLPARGEQPTGSDTSFTLVGSVVRVDLEGGFYGLIDPDGNRFDPDRLPEEFRIDGLAIRARLQPLPPTVGFHMWGKKVHLISIDRR